MPRKSVVIILALTLLGVIAIAQYSLPTFPQSFSARVYARGTFIPSSLTGIAGQGVVLTYMRLSNQSSSTATITVTDQSSDCGGAQCQIMPAVTLAGNSVYFVPLGPDGEYCKGGLTWQATGGNVFGYAAMKY